MTCYEINLLSGCLPETGPSVDATGTGGGLFPFLQSYADLSFGWKAVYGLAASSSVFPVALSGRDQWITRSWLHFSRIAVAGAAGDRRFKDRDPVVEAAVALKHGADHSSSRTVVEAALLAPGATCAEVAARTSIPLPVVEAYEVLFHNVVDRKEDFLYLRNLVYPETRLVEMVENYFSEGDLGLVLSRISYNSGMDDMMHFAGFREAFVSGLDSNKAANLFQEQVMIQGYVLARNGFLNFRRGGTAVDSARQIIQAAKIGGDLDDGGGGDFGIGGAIRADIEAAVGDTSMRLVS